MLYIRKYLFSVSGYSNKIIGCRSTIKTFTFISQFGWHVIKIMILFLALCQQLIIFCWMWIIQLLKKPKKIIVLEKYIWAIRFHIIEKSLVYLIKQNAAGRILLNDNIRYFIILCNIVYYILRYCITSYYFCIML